MKRKLVIAGIVAGIACVVFGTRTVISWARLGTSEARKAVEEAVPLEAQLARLEQETDLAREDIRAALKAGAAISFEVDEAEKNLKAREQELEELREKIRILNEDLKADPNRTAFRYEGRDYARADVEDDLAKKLDRFETVRASVASQREIVQAKRLQLAECEKRMRAFEQRRTRLVVEHAELSAQLAMVKALDKGGKLGIDDSRIAYAENLAESIRRKLGIQKKMIEQQRIVDDPGIDPRAKESKSVTQRADDVLRKAD